jgi:phosphoglycolate phosphatase-like HAD superfamily hydrolase
LNLSGYKSIVFDCDGVVLNSNQVKTQAFYNVTLGYGEGFANKFRDFHVQHGGVSRYKKFEYFLTDIIRKKIDEKEMKKLLYQFSREVKKGLMSCEIAKSLDILRQKTHEAKWFIVSGGDQEELREVFKARGIFEYFNGGIFGSPSCKDTILSNEMHNDNLISPSLFLGDSKYDYEVSVRHGMDFIFISNWSEVHNYEAYCRVNKIQSRENVFNILE